MLKIWPSASLLRAFPFRQSARILRIESILEKNTVSRSIKACMNCGETREIAAHGLCFRCYRQEERRLADELWARPDPSAKELAKNQRNTRKALMKMMDALEEIEAGKLVPQETVEAWRKLLRPEVERIALSLGPAQVNGEQQTEGEQFTESANELSEQANSEQENNSEHCSELADPVNGEQEKVSEPLTEPTSQGTIAANEVKIAPDRDIAPQASSPMTSEKSPEGL